MSLIEGEPIAIRNSRKAAAWGVHLFTASGVAWGFLALLAIQNHDWLLTFFWMAVAVAVDSLDGTLARRLRVQGALPGFDGALLDNVVDYLTYVVVPAFFLYEAGLLPPQFATLGAVLILMASAYQFCQAEAKTEDHFFTGFPSYWNVVVLYLFLWRLSPQLNLLVIVTLVILVFVPVRYVYPSRTEAYQWVTLAVLSLWGALTIAALVQYPQVPGWVMAGSVLCISYYVALSLYLSLGGGRKR